MPSGVVSFRSMTTEQREARGNLLAELADAIDEEKHCCGRLTDYIRRFGMLVEAGKAKILVCQPDEQHGYLFCKGRNEDDPMPASKSFTLPTLDELAEAVEECRNAKSRIAVARDAAISAGIKLSEFVR